MMLNVLLLRSANYVLKKIMWNLKSDIGGLNLHHCLRASVCLLNMDHAESPIWISNRGTDHHYSDRYTVKAVNSVGNNI